MYVYEYKSMYVFVDICQYMHVYIYTYIYIYTHTHVLQPISLAASEPATSPGSHFPCHGERRPAVLVGFRVLRAQKTT